MLTAGHQKDIVLTTRLAEKEGRVAIYGWHQADGTPIQSLSCKHSCRYADYSHGVRLVAEDVTLDGAPRRLSELLQDPALAALVSAEGALTRIAYGKELPSWEEAAADVGGAPKSKVEKKKKKKKKKKN